MRTEQLVRDPVGWNSSRLQQFSQSTKDQPNLFCVLNCGVNLERHWDPSEKMVHLICLVHPPGEGDVA